jgi:hypothetical protein
MKQQLLVITHHDRKGVPPASEASSRLCAAKSRRELPFREVHNRFIYALLGVLSVHLTLLLHTVLFWRRWFFIAYSIFLFLLLGPSAERTDADSFFLFCFVKTS